MHAKRKSIGLISAALVAVSALAWCAVACARCVGEWARFSVNGVQTWLESPSDVPEVTVTWLSQGREHTFLGSTCYIGWNSTQERKRKAFGLAVPHLQGCA
jgi:hypothetical protein